MSTLANVAGGEMAEVGSVDLVDVTKRFGSVAAVDGIDLSVKVGEFLFPPRALRLRQDPQLGD
jgi:hypothetical protein